MMKHKRAVLLAVILLSIFAIALGPLTTRSDTNSRARFDETTRTVTYKGISFSFDSSLAPEVTTETIPASVEGKPSDIWPEHPGFTLVGYPRPRSLSEKDPHIRVFPIPKYRDALAIATKEYARSLVQPSSVEDWTNYLDAEVRLLKSLLARKPAKANLRSVLARARGDKGCGPSMPFLPMWEACQAFVARVQYVKFRNGEGILFLTQMNVGETNQVTNQGLEYAFQGITNDGQNYIYAEFSVAAPLLPKGDEPEVNQWNLKNYLLPHKSAQYQRYVRPIIDKLEALPANKFRPNLSLLVQLVESLDVCKQNKCR